MQFFRGRSFYELVRWAFILRIIKSRIFEDLKKINKERNEIVHKLWCELRRRNFRYLRKKLEFYGRVCYETIDCLEETVPLRGIYGFEKIKPLMFR